MQSIWARRLTTLPRSYKQALMLACDVALLAAAAWGAYALRLGAFVVPGPRQVLLIVAAPVLAVPVFVRAGLYRSVVRFVGEYALWVTLQAMVAAAVLWTCAAFLAAWTGLPGLPRSVPFIYGMLGFLLVGGSRFLARWVLWLPLQRRGPLRQVLVYGTGVAARRVASGLRSTADRFPAGFVDRDPGLHGRDVDGLRVYPPRQLAWLVEHFGVAEVIVALPSGDEAERSAVLQELSRHPVRVRVLPATAESLPARPLVSLVRDPDVDDLLGRPQAVPQRDLLTSRVTGRSVMVTGAGGSIGSELARQLAVLGPARLVLLDSCEHALYQVERQLRAMDLCPVAPVLGSVTDELLLRRSLRRHGVVTLYHAAAYKHVPLVEAHAVEGAPHNVLGTQAVVGAALSSGVADLVLISTDKAVRPVSVMGATKRVAEWLVRDGARGTAGLQRRLSVVRFGNVLGSSGSVVPLFREQIALGGPVTITHPEVSRYFMSVHEAVGLVIQAGGLARGGETFVLDMGEPVRIVDLARRMVAAAGRSVRDGANPGGDVELVVTGLRPGEKLHEELLVADGAARPTDHPRIVQADEPLPDAAELAELVARLREAVDERDDEAVRELLFGGAEAGDANGAGDEVLGVLSQAAATEHGAAGA